MRPQVGGPVVEVRRNGSVPRGKSLTAPELPQAGMISRTAGISSEPIAEFDDERSLLALKLPKASMASWKSHSGQHALCPYLHSRLAVEQLLEIFIEQAATVRTQSQGGLAP